MWRHLVCRQRHRLLTRRLPQWMLSAEVNWSAATQIGERESSAPVAAVGSAQNREERLVLIDRQHLPVTHRPAFRCEVKADHSDLGEKRLGHTLSSTMDSRPMQPYLPAPCIIQGRRQMFKNQDQLSCDCYTPWAFPGNAVSLNHYGAAHDGSPPIRVHERNLTRGSGFDPLHSYRHGRAADRCEGCSVRHGSLPRQVRCPGRRALLPLWHSWGDDNRTSGRSYGA